MTTTTATITTSILSCLVIAAASDGAMIAVSDASLFNAIVESEGVLAGENFGGFDGFYASGLTGGTGASAWTATASGGLYASGGIMSTNYGAAALTFTFSDPTVFAIGGNFFLTDIDFGLVIGTVIVTSNNYSYVYSTNGVASTFAGFISTSGAIQSISIRPLMGSNYSSATTVAIGFVPAPAVLGVFAAAGLIRRRRRD